MGGGTGDPETASLLQGNDDGGVRREGISKVRLPLRERAIKELMIREREREKAQKGGTATSRSSLPSLSPRPSSVAISDTAGTPSNRRTERSSSLGKVRSGIVAMGCKVTGTRVEETHSLLAAHHGEDDEEDERRRTEEEDGDDRTCFAEP